MLICVLKVLLNQNSNFSIVGMERMVMPSASHVPRTTIPTIVMNVWRAECVKTPY